MIELFLKGCLEKDDNYAFIFKRGKKVIRKTYKELYQDFSKIITILKTGNLKPGDKVLLFILPSYEFYITFLACIYYGLNIVIIDSFKDKEKLKSALNQVDIKTILVNNKTKLFKVIFDKKYNYLNVSGYQKLEFIKYDYVKYDGIVLTTFTSGTTSLPKPIERSIKDLEKQVSLIKENVDIKDSKVVLCGLPIYTLLLLLHHMTVVLNKRIDLDLIKHTNVDSILMPIEKVLKSSSVIPQIKYMYLGGAILYNNEASHILSCYPNALIEYVYGSSEGVLISKTNLKEYKSHRFNKSIIGMNVELVEFDSNNVGQIKISGSNLVGNSNYHLTGDLAYYDNGLCIVGRKKYSKEGIYNYLLDEELLAENKNLKKGFSFVYNNNLYFAYEGKISKKRENIIYLKYRRLPMDSKHKTKLNYPKVINNIK